MSNPFGNLRVAKELNEPRREDNTQGSKGDILLFRRVAVLVDRLLHHFTLPPRIQIPEARESRQRLPEGHHSETWAIWT